MNPGLNRLRFWFNEWSLAFCCCFCVSYLLEYPLNQVSQGGQNFDIGQISFTFLQFRIEHFMVVNSLSDIQELIVSLLIP